MAALTAPPLTICVIVSVPVDSGDLTKVYPLEVKSELEVMVSGC